MRLWHYRLLPYLPDAQFKGQLREMVSIMHDWRDKGRTNHILINRVMDYQKSDFYSYFLEYAVEYEKRYDGNRPKCLDEFKQFCGCFTWPYNPFVGWHDKTYLRICMANLLEKHMGTGRSRITDEEWARLLKGYREITGEDYEI